MKSDFKQPTEAFLRGIDIHTLLPQQEPFVMVSRLTHFDQKRTMTETDIRHDLLFVDNQELSAFGLIENIAQTCAARIGFVNKYILKKGIQIGVIGAISQSDIQLLPTVGQTITTTVDVEEEVFGMILANATIRQGSRTLMTSKIKIAIKNEEVS